MILPNLVYRHRGIFDGEVVAVMKMKTSMVQGYG